MKDPIKQVFKDDMKVFLAVQYITALEHLVYRGRQIAKKKWFEEEIVAAALEKRGAPIIRAILGCMNPEISEYVQGMDERAIWRIFWGLRSQGEEITISALLGELNSNPPLAGAIA